MGIDQVGNREKRQATIKNIAYLLVMPTAKLRNVNHLDTQYFTLVTRRYYSSRTKPKSLELAEICEKVKSCYMLFRDRAYFKEKAGISGTDVPDAIKHEASIVLSFQPFPIENLNSIGVIEDEVFDLIEFLYDHVSKPGDWGYLTTETGWNYQDFLRYDVPAGKLEFRGMVNSFLCDYKTGYEVTEEGTVLALGADGLQHILSAEIIPYDDANVDSKVRAAIAKWRNRHLSLDEKKQAIRELADVFEWLKKSKGLATVLDRKDEAMIFDIANNFGIRHHNPDQKINYDRNIWYSWIFHFYLATYHAAVRLLIKQEREKQEHKKVSI